MKSKNYKERRQSILKFALLFIITMAIIVTAFYFDFDRVPFKENKLLREQSVAIQNEFQFQEKFSTEMEEISSLLDSLDIPGQNLSYINYQIDTKIVDLQNSIPKEDSTYRYDMYANIVNSFVNMQEYKNKLNEYSDVDARLVEFKEKLEEAREDLTECNRTLDIYRLKNN
ncbi:hypothetical protein GCM10009117_25530 [Gangjinia marincola]|uniref:Type VI secretion system transmembrane protein TssO n=1 Tax=Gangjinia marincola TaxID=578463 RepID=A0ABN1MJJ5_9FLAO